MKKHNKDIYLDFFINEKPLKFWLKLYFKNTIKDPKALKKKLKMCHNK